MNIVPPVPTPTVFSAGTVNTEAVRRDNTQREVIPQLSAAEKSAAEAGVGSDADRAKAPGQAQQQVTYEKPVSQTSQQLNNQNQSTPDNGQDASAGKENAEQQQRQQQAEQQQITELKQRDAEVRAHEQAHASTGGEHAGSPQYQYETGPDGRQYAVEGEVSIDVSEESTPEETIRKAQQVKAAALAPAEPSAQDLRVASEATQIALEARTEIANEKAEQAQQAFKEATADVIGDDNTQSSQVGATAPELDEIVDGLDVTIPTRSLDIGDAGADVNSDNTNQQISEFFANRDEQVNRRVSVIENFYQQVTSPRSEGVELSA